ncbi:hypothetical protein Tco_1139067 [Tanacetum coccineum]
MISPHPRRATSSEPLPQRPQLTRGHTPLPDKVDSRDLTKQSKEHYMRNQREKVNAPKRDNRRGVRQSLKSSSTFTWYKTYTQRRACESHRNKQATDGNPGFLPEDRLREICEKHYNQILPIMAENIHQEKLKGVKRKTKKGGSPSPCTMSRGTRPGQSPSLFSRLWQRESSFTRQRSLASTTMFTRLCARDRNVFTRLEDAPVQECRPKTQIIEGEGQGTSSAAMSHALAKDIGKSKKNRIRPTEQTVGGLLELKICISLKASMTVEDAGSPKQRGKDQLMKRTCPNLGYERRPTRSRHVSATSKYKMLQKAFLGNFSQQKKYIKDPIEIHHIKQKEGESTEAFMERFKAISMHVNGAPKCMRISGFMHGITNPDLIKRLNDNIPKSMDKMMSVTMDFFREEVAVAKSIKKEGPTSMETP